MADELNARYVSVFVEKGQIKLNINIDYFHIAEVIFASVLENLRHHEPTQLHKAILEAQESNFGRSLRVVVRDID